MNYKRGSIGLFFRGDPTLKLWLPFEENSGTTALDLSGNGNHGTISGALRTKGKIGNGLYFDGVNDYVSIANSSSIQFANAISVLYWIKTNTTTSGMPISKGQEREYYCFGAGAISLAIYPGGSRLEQYSNFNHFNDNQWHLFVGTYANSTAGGDGKIRIYVDGKFDAISAANNNTLRVENKTLALGQSSAGSQWFNANLDEVSLFSRALSPKEISDYYLWSIGTPQRRIFYVPINTSNFFHFFR